MMPAISLKDKIREIGGKSWSPVDVARVNDQIIRMALLKGEFHWHRHADEHELFYVYKGNIVIQFKDRPDINLNEGEITVVPKGVEHCPKSTEDSYVLLFEPLAVNTKGD